MRNCLKTLTVVVIAALLVNLMSPFALANNNVSTQDSSTQEKNVEFDARLCKITEQETVSKGYYSETYDIWEGGILQLTIKVKETGYLKDAKISFKDNNFLLNDFSHVSVTKLSAYNPIKLTKEDMKTAIPQKEIHLEDEVVSEGADTVGNSSLETTMNEAEKSFNYNYESDDAPVLVEKIENDAKNRINNELAGITALEKVDVDTNEVIKKIDSDGIELNEIVSNRVVTITLPIMFPIDEYVEENVFYRNSEVSIKGTYMNEVGKEKSISKSILTQVKWTTECESETTQQVFRYMKVNDKQVILSMKLKDMTKDNKLPYTSKEIDVTKPQINGKDPSTYKITGKISSCKEENNVLRIGILNHKDSEGRLKWATDDTLIITYVYDLDTVPETTTVSSDVESIIRLATGERVEGSIKDTSYEINGSKGNVVDLTFSAPAELGKGIMYTNLVRTEEKFDTDFYEIATINVAYSELVDRFELAQKNKNEYIINKKASVDKDEFNQILGKNGFIEVYNEKKELLGTINASNLSLDITDRTNITFKSSKPEGEGNLTITLNKAVPSDLTEISKYDITALTRFNDTLTIEGYSNGNLVTSNEINVKINLLEPETKADLKVSADNLSTTRVNSNVEFTMTLETDSIDDALYENPDLEIVLPEEVRQIDLKEAKLLFENELKITNCSVDKNTIKINLQGIQTRYSTQAVSKGTIIKVVADILVSEFANSKTSEIKFNYKNSATSENKTQNEQINIVAPQDFVLTNSLFVDKVGNITAGEDDPQSIDIPTGQEKIAVTVSGSALNNLERTANGVIILGRTFGKESTEPNGSGDKLEASFDAEMTSGVKVSGTKDYKVYYSENGDANLELEDSNNGWTEEFNENTKSYLIVINENVENGKQITFEYAENIPENMQADENSIETFALYYDKESVNEEENSKNNKQASTCELKTTTTATKTGSKKQIDIGSLLKRATASYVTSPSQDDNNNKSTSNSISGLVWDDINRNGKRADDEKKIEGIEIILYNRSDNTIAKRESGIELKTTSDYNGQYELNNIPNGQYYLVAKYKTAEYGVSTYQVTDAEEDKNSDFIEAMMNNERVATTDIISINNSNYENIDLGLDSSERFDLTLDTRITKVTVTNPDEKTETKTYDGSKLLKREFLGTRVNNDTILVEYTIKVINEGNIAGYVNSIVDYIPDEMTFDSEINPDWFITGENNVYTNKFQNEIINPGETREIKIVLTKKMTGDSVGLIHNTAEIAKSYNSKAISDSDSIPGNKKDGEDDISSADIFLGIQTGKEIIQKALTYVLIFFGFILVIVLFTRIRAARTSNKIYKWKGDGIKKGSPDDDE